VLSRIHLPWSRTVVLFHVGSPWIGGLNAFIGRLPRPVVQWTNIARVVPPATAVTGDWSGDCLSTPSVPRGDGSSGTAAKGAAVGVGTVAACVDSGDCWELTGACWFAASDAHEGICCHVMVFPRITPNVQRYVLSPELAAVMKCADSTKSELLQFFWRYTEVRIPTS
jgi:hypothetical protein